MHRCCPLVFFFFGLCSYYGLFYMLQMLLDYFKGDSSCAQQRKRLRRMADSSTKICRFCQASVSCDVPVCKNCLSPFARGLGNQKWLAGGRERGGMASIDAVKYKAASSLEHIVHEGRKTLQNISLSARFKTT